MKRALTFFAVLGLVAMLAGGASANLLLNAALDSPGGGATIDDWTKDESKTFSGPTSDLITLEPWAGPSPTPVTANDEGGFFKAFQGNVTTGDLATCHLTQDVAGAAGLTYLLSGWAGAEANYSGFIPGTATQSQLAIEFDDDNDRGNGILGDSVLDLQAAGLGGVAGVAFGYQQFAVSGTAPAGTTVVRARVSMIDGYGNPAGGGQAFVIDDFSLSVVPEPASLTLIGLGLLGLVALRRR